MEMESDSDNNDVNSTNSNASVHLYMPVDQESVDSAGDGVWQNATLGPPHPSSHPEAGASYIPLQCMPQHTYSQQWHVFTDSSDSSDTDDPLVDFGHIVIPAPSQPDTSVKRSDRYPHDADRYLCLEVTEPSDSCRQNDTADFGQPVADANVPGAGVVYPS